MNGGKQSRPQSTRHSTQLRGKKSGKKSAQEHDLCVCFLCSKE